MAYHSPSKVFWASLSAKVFFLSGEIPLRSTIMSYTCSITGPDGRKFFEVNDDILELDTWLTYGTSVTIAVPSRGIAKYFDRYKNFWLEILQDNAATDGCNAKYT